MEMIEDGELELFELSEDEMKNIEGGFSPCTTLCTPLCNAYYAEPSDC